MHRCAFARGVDEAQYRRMHAVDARREFGVAAIHRERVLRQIVGADRQEIDFAREFGGEHGGRGRFDHGAERRRRRARPSCALRRACAARVRISSMSVIIGSRMRTCPTGCTAQHRAQLHGEQVRPPQAGAHAAQSQRRIVFRRQR